MCVCVYIYIYLHIQIYKHIHIHIYTYLLPASTHYYWSPLNNQVFQVRVSTPLKIRACWFWVFCVNLLKIRLGFRFVVGMGRSWARVIKKSSGLGFRASGCIIGFEEDSWEGSNMEDCPTAQSPECRKPPEPQDPESPKPPRLKRPRKPKTSKV